MTAQICIIGCGKMGKAVLSGWLAADNKLDAAAFCVVENSQEQAEVIQAELGVQAYTSIADALVENGPFSMYLLAVKPQVMPQVLEDLAAALAFAGEDASELLIVSIAAGITTDQIAKALPKSAKVVRVMPNTPLQVGVGATVVCVGPGATQADVSAVRDMFAQLGIAEIVTEAEIDAVCALSGGGPAYTALMIEALTAAGVEQGLSAALAEKLALQTIYGTCRLIAETGASPEQTRVAVCSPGGTTLAALSAMEEGGFSRAISAGVAAAVARAKELAAC